MEDIVMGAVMTEKSKAAGAVVEEPTVLVQAGPVDEQLVTAEAIAAALDPDLVARLAAQARRQGVQLLGRGGVLQQLTSGSWRPPWRRRWMSTWATTSTIRLGATAATRVTASGP